MVNEENEKVLNEALKRFNICQDADRNQRRLAIEDMRFVNAEDGQWAEADLVKRANRPRFTFNRIAGVVDQLTGDQRENRTNIKVRPVSGGASEDIADIFNGLIRNIEVQSSANNSYDNAYDEKVTGGFGGWRILTEFNDDDSFEQDIKIKPINSAASSHWIDPSAQEYDKRDSNYQFLVTDMSMEDFNTQFPDASITNFNVDMYRTNTQCKGWFGKDVIKVAEYWRKTPVIKNIALMSNNKVIDLDEEKDVLDELADQGITVVKERKVKSFKVEMFKMNGAEILQGPIAWAGKYIPLVPDYGKISHIEGDTLVRGVTRFAKDANRVYNYTQSTNVETVALTPKDPYWLTQTQAAGLDDQFNTFATKNQPFMIYNSDPTAPGAPQRTGAPSVQSALIQQSQQAIDDIHATTNMYPPAMGNAPQLLSEKSVLAQAEKGDRGAFVYQDNHAKSIEFTGIILMDLIPHIYDTPRMVRVLGIDGKSEQIAINQDALSDINQPIIDEETGKQVIVNDLSLGKYDVITETGPAFNTLRQESAQQLIDLAAASPTFETLATDLIAKNLNILENDELTKRVRKLMIQNGIVDPTDEEVKELGLDQPQAPDENAMALKDNVIMQTEKLKSDIEKNDAATQKTLVDTSGSAIEAYNELLTAFQKQVELGIPLTVQQRNLLIQQGDLVGDSQDILQGADNPNSEQAEDLARLAGQGELDIE